MFNKHKKFKINLKMSGFYITEVKLKKETEFETSEDFLNKKSIEKNMIQSAFLVKNTKEFDEKTSEILNFMIGEETDFTDLMKIEDFFKKETIKYCEEYNVNRNSLDKKQNLLKKLQLEIEEVIKNFLLLFLLLIFLITKI
jgi:hypothetical protein